MCRDAACACVQGGRNGWVIERDRLHALKPLATHPALQFPVQLLATLPPAPNRPGRQAREQGVPRAVAGLYRPGAQSVHAPEPAGEYLPAGHEVTFATRDPAGQVYLHGRGWGGGGGKWASKLR